MVNVGDTVRASVEGIVTYDGGNDTNFAIDANGLEYTFYSTRPFKCEVLKKAHILPTEPGSQVIVDMDVYTLTKRGWYRNGFYYEPADIALNTWTLVS
jgi:hypothetical protein